MKFQDQKFSETFTVVDPATQRQVRIAVHGAVDTTVTPGQRDPHELMGHLQRKLLATTHEAIAGALQRGEVALITLPQSIPTLLDRVMPQVSALYLKLGVAIDDVRLQIRLPDHQAQQAPPMGQLVAHSAAQTAQSYVPQNVEVEAELRVGGFDFNVSSDGGFDHSGFESQVKDEIGWKLIGAGIFLVAFVAVVGVIGYSVYRTKVGLEDSGALASDEPGDDGEEKTAAWDGKQPYKCDERGNVRIENVVANLKEGPAIEVTSSCKLTLSNVDITTAADGVKVFGKGEVIIEGGSIDSAATALSAVGKQTKIVVKGATIKGKTKAVGGSIEGLEG